MKPTEIGDRYIFGEVIACRAGHAYAGVLVIPALVSVTLTDNSGTDYKTLTATF